MHPRITAPICGVAAIMGLAACSVHVGVGHTTTQATPSHAADPARPVGSDRIDLTLTGTVNSHITTYNGAPQCEFSFNDLNNKYVYEVTFPINLNGQNGTFRVLISDADRAGGTYTIAQENISVDGTDDGHLHWGGAFGSVGSSGTVLLAADHSGTVDGAIKARTGTDNKFQGDGTLLQVKGSWNCARFADPNSPSPSPASG